MKKQAIIQPLLIIISLGMAPVCLGQFHHDHNSAETNQTDKKLPESIGAGKSEADTSRNDASELQFPSSRSGETEISSDTEPTTESHDTPKTTVQRHLEDERTFAPTEISDDTSYSIEQTEQLTYEETSRTRPLVTTPRSSRSSSISEDTEEISQEAGQPNIATDNQPIIKHKKSKQTVKELFKEYILTKQGLLIGTGSVFAVTSIGLLSYIVYTLQHNKYQSQNTTRIK